MTVLVRSGLERLVTGVRQFLVDQGVDAAVSLSKKALTDQMNQGPGRANRIVIVPFDPDSGSAGRMVPGSHVGEVDIMSGVDPTVRVATARILGDWERNMVVAVWAANRAEKNDEFAQALALEALIEKTRQAVDNVGFADVEWGDVRVIPPKERAFGLEARLGLKFTHPIFDVPIEVGHPDFEIDKGD